MNLITVVPFARGLPKGELSYFSVKEIPVFSLVSISLRNKKTLGLVVATRPMVESKIDIKKAEFNLKKILEVKEKSIFRDELLTSAIATSEYFLAKKSHGVDALLPSILKEEYDKVAKWCTEISTTQANPEVKPEKLLFQAPEVERISYYKTLIRGHFAKKQSVWLILPTITQVEDFEALLGKGIEQFTFSFSSNLSDKKILEKTKAVLDLEHPVLLISTPQYLAIPRGDIGTMILEHENSTWKTHKPILDLRYFVEQFAEKLKVRLVLADTILRFETLARKEKEGLGSVRNDSFKLGFDGSITLEDKKTERDGEQYKIFSPRTLDILQRNLEAKKNVFVFSLRKGLGTMTICRDCGEILLCKNCQAPIVLYLSKDKIKRMYSCNKCGQVESAKEICAHCSSWNLESYGVGTEGVASELEKSFPGTPVFKLDKNSAQNAKEAKKIISEFENTRGAILVGTELALAYLKEKVETSVVASFDSLWSIPNFRMSEKIISLVFSITQKTTKSLIIQTKNTEDLALDAILKDNLLNFVREELEARKKLGYPPYKKFIKLTHLGDEADKEKVKEFLEEYFKDYNPLVYSAFIEKVKGRYITHTLLKVEPENWSIDTKTGRITDQVLYKKLQALIDTFMINVEPDDLL